MAPSLASPSAFPCDAPVVEQSEPRGAATVGAKAGGLRAIALGVVWRGASILVGEGHDAVKAETFYRPLGGGIAFGERGDDALRREFHEEIGVEIEIARQLGALENIFTYAGRPGHEICLIYEATLRDASLYRCERFEGAEEDGMLFLATWKPLTDFTGGDRRYPDGLLAILQRAKVSSA